MFRIIIKALLIYVLNQILHVDLQMKAIPKTAKKSYTRYHNYLNNYPKILVKTYFNQFLKRNCYRSLLLHYYLHHKTASPNQVIF